MRPLVVLGLLFLGVWGCSVGDSEFNNLRGPEILYIQADPPALIPPGEVTLSVRIYDPQFLVEGIHWYLPVSTSIYDLSRWVRSLDRLKDPLNTQEGFLYLGSGAQVTVVVPELPAELARNTPFYDTLPLPVLVVVARRDGTVLKGMKRVRLVFPELVEELLKQQGEPVTAAAVTREVERRLNQNPKVEELLLYRAPPRGTYPEEGLSDLKVRRELAAVPLTEPLLPGAGRYALRLIPHLQDPDLAKNIPKWAPGYNYLTVEYRVRRGSLYPLTLTSTDWIPLRFRERQEGFRSRLVEDELPPGIYTVYGIVLDHQGGVAGFAIDVDLRSPPPLKPALLLRSGRRLLWVHLSPEAATASVGSTVTLPVELYEDLRYPLGVTAAYTLRPPARYTLDLDRLEADPLYRKQWLHQPVWVEGKVLRRE